MARHYGESPHLRNNRREGCELPAVCAAQTHACIFTEVRPQRTPHTLRVLATENLALYARRSLTTWGTLARKALDSNKKSNKYSINTTYQSIGIGFNEHLRRHCRQCMDMERSALSPHTRQNEQHKRVQHTRDEISLKLGSKLSHSRETWNCDSPNNRHEASQDSWKG